MTNIYISSLSTWLQDNYWWLIIGGVILVALMVYFLRNKQTKEVTYIPIEDEQMMAFIECYGGIDNIQKAELDGRRLKCLLNDIDQVNIERFKSLGATGIFITGKHIKMVLPYDMQKLVNYIEFKNAEGKG